MDSRGQRQVLREADKEAVAAVTEALGSAALRGRHPRHGWLSTRVRKCRLICAQTLVGYEKPALSLVDNTIEDKRSHIARLANQVVDAQEWLCQYGGLKCHGGQQ